MVNQVNELHKRLDQDIRYLHHILQFQLRKGTIGAGWIIRDNKEVYCLSGSTMLKQASTVSTRSRSISLATRYSISLVMVQRVSKYYFRRRLSSFTRPHIQSKLIRTFQQNQFLWIFAVGRIGLTNISFSVVP